MMGILPDEPSHQQGQRKKTSVQIDHSFDVGMTEVTVRQFRRFLEDRGSKDQKKSHSAMQTGLAFDMPVTQVNWYEAAHYCNWLSEQDEIPRDQWCYEPNDNGDFAEGMKIVADATRKIGYRLLTEAEWEFACRAGATTMRCYGDDDELLPRYAWYAANSGDKDSPVAKLLPNAFGLFDMHGNAIEWCQDKYHRSYGDDESGGMRQVLIWANGRLAAAALSRFHESGRSVGKRFARP